MGIRFTKEDLARVLPPSSGWQKIEVQSVEVTQKVDPDTQKISNTYKFTFEIIESAEDDKNIGRSCIRYFSSKALSFFIPLLSAIWNCSAAAAVEKVNGMEPEFEPVNLKGAKAWNELKDSVYKEKPRVEVSDKWSNADEEPPF